MEEKSIRRVDTLAVVGGSVSAAMIAVSHALREEWLPVFIVVAFAAVVLPLAFVHDRRVRAHESYASSRRGRAGRTMLVALMVLFFALYVLALIFWI